MKRTVQLCGFILLLVGAVAAMGQNPPAPEYDDAARRAEEIITEKLLRGHTTFLADDLLEGRAPGTRGGQLAAKYIAAQFERLGLEPMALGDDYFQEFALVGKKLTEPAVLRVSGRGRGETFKYVDEFVPFTDLDQRQVDVEGELVFVGYGITAPEFNWDDFKGTDVRGKILVGLVNDPPATAAEPELFGGKALTYYGRWTYKYEEASRQGATGAILIHTTESAGYPFTVVQTSWTGEQYDLPRLPGAALAPLRLKAWVSEEAGRRLLALAGQEFEALVAAAARRDFRPAPLKLTAATQLTQTVRRIETANVIGILRGTDPERSKEYIVWTAHYDHLGRNEELGSDQIYNGAADNAVGVAAFLGIAEALARLEGGSKRSHVFVAAAAEESGLLGSAHYARNPVAPPARTVANINIDGLNTWGPTRDIVLIGYGKSELDEVARIAAERNRLKVAPDQFPEKGFFYRSDQFNLAKVGVPALYFDAGLDLIGRPEGFGKEKFEEYTAKDYHQPSDEIKADWDWQGAVQMARYLFEAGWLAATWERGFEWAPDAEFRAARLESLQEYRQGTE